MKRVILTFAAGFAIAFSLGFSPGREQAGLNGPWCYEVCEDVCHGPAFCSDCRRARAQGPI